MITDFFIIVIRSEKVSSFLFTPSTSTRFATLNFRFGDKTLLEASIILFYLQYLKRLINPLFAPTSSSIFPPPLQSREKITHQEISCESKCFFFLLRHQHKWQLTCRRRHETKHKVVFFFSFSSAVLMATHKSWLFDFFSCFYSTQIICTQERGWVDDACD